MPLIRRIGSFARRPTLIALALVAIALTGAMDVASEPDPLIARARAIHRDAIVVDTHADLTPMIQCDVAPAAIDDPGIAGPGYDAREAPSRRRPMSPFLEALPQGPWTFTARNPVGYMDLPRMREGGLDAQFFAIYTEEDPRPGMPVKTALGQIAAIHALAAKYPRDVAVAVTARDVRSIVRSGRVAALMGVEGGHMIDDDISILRAYAQLGVRYVAPTHSINVHWADSSGTGQPVAPAHGGLSPFGVEVVREANRLGVLVDVTHVSDETFFDVLAATKAPVVASHSGVDGVKEHPRNMSDAMLKALARNGGVIQIIGVTKYLDPVARARTPLDVFIAHIEHALKVAGPDHVGIGMDYSFRVIAPIGLEDCSKYGAITYELLKRGHSEAVVRKVLGENTLRIMAEAERVAARLATAGASSH